MIVSKKIVIFILPLFLLAAPGCSASIPENRLCPTIRIGSYNILDLFDDVDDPHKSDSETADPDRLLQLADVILTADCDILMLQEVENISVLTEFNLVYLDGHYPEVILVEGNDPRGIDVGVLSQLPLTNVVSFADREFENPYRRSTSRFSRDLLSVQWIDPTGQSWTFLTTHLKAGSDWYDGVLRQLQAEEIAEICRERNFVSPTGRGLTVLAGDLNAQPWTNDLAALRDVPFSDPARDLPYRFTHASGMILDYILLSPDADRRYVVGSFKIFRDPPADEASDHYLVCLDLRIR